MTNDNFIPLVQDCCICGGQGTLRTTGSAYLVVDNKEYRVFYHRTCLSEETKPKVIKFLNEKAGVSV